VENSIKAFHHQVDPKIVFVVKFAGWEASSQQIEIRAKINLALDRDSML
jgi:hypothetical protein